MSEFYDQPTVQPTATDELIVIRDRSPKRAKVSDFLSSDQSQYIAFSKTPPTNKALWWQLDDSNKPVELWLLRPGGVWVSDRAWTISEFEFEVKRNWAWALPNPCPGASIWIDDFTARAWVQDSISNADYIDFELKTVNIQQEKIPLFYLRLQNAARGDVFNVSETVHQLVSVNDAIGLWLSITRRGQRKIKTASLAATVRKVYATSNEQTA